MYKFSILLKHSKMISVTFLVGFLFNCSGSNSSDEFVQEISIKFSASKTNIVLGDSTILSWATETGANCIAGDGWTGNKQTSGNETIFINNFGDNIFSLTCSNDSSSKKVSIIVKGISPFEDEPANIYGTTKYKEICNKNTVTFPSFQFLIPIKLNNDNIQDFIAHYWCDISQELWGTDQDQSTPDLIIAYLSDESGWYDGSFEIFGEEYPKLGGASRNYALGDINNDGKVDIAFAMNQEDGRSHSDWTTARTKPAAIISANDKYKIINIGEPEWGHSVEMVDNEFGFKDVLFAGFTGIGLQAFRWEIDKFNNVTRLYPPSHYFDEDGNMSETGSNAWATEMEANGNLIVATDNLVDGSEKGFSIWEKDSQNLWIKKDSFFTKRAFQISWISWQEDLSYVDVFEIDGRYIVDYTPQTMCFLNNFSENDEGIYTVALYSGGEYKYGDIDPENTYNQDDFNVLQFVKLYKYESKKITELEKKIIGVNEEIFANFISCNDINNDGFSELVRNVFSREHGYSTPWLRGGAPEVFINNKLNELENYELTTGFSFPGHRYEQNSMQGFMDDINDDGITDIVVYGERVSSADGNIEIYFGKRNLNLPN